MKFSIDSTTLSKIVAMRKNNPFLNKPATENQLLRGGSQEFLTLLSPPKSLYHLQPLSPPLFPRRKRQRRGTTTLHGGPATLAEATASFQPVEVENMDLDIPKENMVIVDGWSALKVIITSQQRFDMKLRLAAIETSSQTSNTPSLSSGTSEVDQLDDMWLPTSDADPMAPILAADLKMGARPNSTYICAHTHNH